MEGFHLVYHNDALGIVSEFIEWATATVLYALLLQEVKPPQREGVDALLLQEVYPPGVDDDDNRIGLSDVDTV